MHECTKSMKPKIQQRTAKCSNKLLTGEQMNIMCKMWKPEELTQPKTDEKNTGRETKTAKRCEKHVNSGVHNGD